MKDIVHYALIMPHCDVTKPELECKTQKDALQVPWREMERGGHVIGSLGGKGRIDPNKMGISVPLATHSLDISTQLLPFSFSLITIKVMPAVVNAV